MRNGLWTFTFVVLALIAQVAAAQTREPAPGLDIDLIARLQPLRPRQESLPPPLVAVAKLIARKSYPQACKQVVNLRTDLLHKAAPLFYQPDRRRGGDVEGVSAFLRRYVEGPKPLLQIVQETFVPAQAMRALAVDACVRANQPQQAVPFVADLALLSNDAQSRLALALLKAQAAQSWQAGMTAIDRTVTGPRAALLRALAGQPPGAQALCAQAWREAASPEEVALAQQVAKLLHQNLPATPAGEAP